MDMTYNGLSKAAANSTAVAMFELYKARMVETLQSVNKNSSVWCL
jgi:hypothetical protein